MINKPQQSEPNSPISSPAPIKSISIRKPVSKIFETQKIITELENLFSQKVICYYLPSGNDINQNHPDIFLDHLRQLGPQESLTLVIISYGGDSSASLRIASVIREHTKNLQIVVPSRCASAATVLALAAEKIIMCSSGYLTAIDTSLFHGLNPVGPDNRQVSVSVDQVKRIIRFLNEEGPAVIENQKEGSYRTLFKYIHPLIIGEIDRISSRTIMVATKMMNMHPQSFENEEKINWIAQHLYNDYPEHGFPILYQEAKEIGLPVEKADSKTTDLLRKLVNLYDTSTLIATTHLSETFFHEEYFTVTIESLGSRSVYHGSLDHRLNSITRRWQVENNTSRWVNIIPKDSSKGEIVLVPLDYTPVDDKSELKPHKLPASEA